LENTGPPGNDESWWEEWSIRDEHCDDKLETEHALGVAVLRGLWVHFQQKVQGTREAIAGALATRFALLMDGFSQYEHTFDWNTGCTRTTQVIAFTLCSDIGVGLC